MFEKNIWSFVWTYVLKNNFNYYEQLNLFSTNCTYSVPPSSKNILVIKKIK